MDHQRHYLVSGVGRSGTTAIYQAVYDYLSLTDGPNFRFFYEPELWGPSIWASNPREVDDSLFGMANSLHIGGIYAHERLPLFLSKRRKILNEFLSTIFGLSENSLC